MYYSISHQKSEVVNSSNEGEFPRGPLVPKHVVKSSVDDGLINQLHAGWDCTHTGGVRE